MAAPLHMLMTTVGNAADAKRIALEAVEQRLAACVQIVPIESVYRWDGEVVGEPEMRLLFKTSAQRGAALHAWLAKLHPYDVPCIVSLPMAGVNAEYSTWLMSELASSPV